MWGYLLTPLRRGVPVGDSAPLTVLSLVLKGIVP